MRKKARDAARIAAAMGLSAVLALGGTPILAVAAEPDDLGSSAAVGVQSGEEEGSDGSDAVVGEAEAAGGTADDPYIISSIDDLKLFRETVNGTGLTYEG